MSLLHGVQQARGRSEGRPLNSPPEQFAAFSALKLFAVVGLFTIALTSSQLRTSLPFASAVADTLKLDSTSAHPECRGHHGCLRWHSSTQIGKLNMSVILVGNEAYQQFPLLGYGGIETSVENIAAGLHAFKIPFVVIIPHRDNPPPYPFPIYDTAVFSNGKGNVKDKFVQEVHDIIAGLHDATGKSSAFVMWGQSVWSQHFATAPGVRLGIVSHHDGKGPPSANWDFGIHSVRHRFLSDDQRSRWVGEKDSRFKSTKVVPHGLPPDDFFTCPDGGYFLWVASLDWGWEEKGLNIFVDLATRRKDKKFIAYGGAVLRHDLVDRVQAIARDLPNFEYRSVLMRGSDHRQAFCGATAFLMPTNPSIGESFGMTVIESLSKGVPVIASTSSAVPELLGVTFGQPRRGKTEVGSVCDSIDDYLTALDTWGNRSAATSARIQQWSEQRYSIGSVVDALLLFSINTAEEVGVLVRDAQQRVQNIR